MFIRMWNHFGHRDRAGLIRHSVCCHLNLRKFYAVLHEPRVMSPAEVIRAAIVSHPKSR